MTIAETMKLLAALATGDDQFDFVLSRICQAIDADPNCKEELLDSLDAHENLILRHASWSARERTITDRELITDIELARQKTPLKPGTFIKLNGGYTSVYDNNDSPWRGEEPFWRAKVIDLVILAPGKPPLLWAELDERKQVGEISGRFVLLKLRYVANWNARETVSVCQLDRLPMNLARFYGEYPYFPNEEIETHASYRIDDSRKAVAPTRAALEADVETDESLVTALLRVFIDQVAYRVEEAAELLSLISDLYFVQSSDRLNISNSEWVRPAVVGLSPEGQALLSPDASDPDEQGSSSHSNEAASLIRYNLMGEIDSTWTPRARHQFAESLHEMLDPSIHRFDLRFPSASAVGLELRATPRWLKVPAADFGQIPVAFLTRCWSTEDLFLRGEANRRVTEMSEAGGTPLIEVDVRTKLQELTFDRTGFQIFEGSSGIDLFFVNLRQVLMEDDGTRKWKI